MTGSRSAVSAFSARVCACLEVTFFAGSLESGELARLARGFRAAVRDFDTSVDAVAFARTAVFILGGGLGGGTGVFVRVDALVVVPVFDLVAILQSIVSAKCWRGLRLGLTRKR